MKLLYQSSPEDTVLTEEKLGAASLLHVEKGW